MSVIWMDLNGWEHAQYQLWSKKIFKEVSTQCKKSVQFNDNYILEFNSQILNRWENCCPVGYWMFSCGNGTSFWKFVLTTLHWFSGHYYYTVLFLTAAACWLIMHHIADCVGVPSLLWSFWSDRSGLIILGSPFALGWAFIYACQVWAAFTLTHFGSGPKW